MATKRIGGIITLKVDGAQKQAKGSFTYNIGTPKREPVIGSDGVHGYKETPQVAYIEGEITDDVTSDLKALTNTTGATITLDLPNGKSVILRDAWYAAEGNVQTEEGNVQVRFESTQPGEEIQ